MSAVRNTADDGGHGRTEHLSASTRELLHPMASRTPHTIGDEVGVSLPWAMPLPSTFPEGGHVGKAGVVSAGINSSKLSAPVKWVT
jgi:hypothetical protein